jgi:hypothetical protein
MGLELPLPWFFCDVDNTLIRPANVCRMPPSLSARTGSPGEFSLATGKHPLSIHSTGSGTRPSVRAVAPKGLLLALTG